MNFYEKWDEFFISSLNIEVPDLNIGEELVIVGMGGSGIVGRVLSILELPVELKVYRNFKAKVKEYSNVFILTYSGETTETLVALRSIIDMKPKDIIVFSSGDNLKKYCSQKNIKYVELPKGFQTRFAFPFIFTPLIKILNNSFNLKLNLNSLYLGIKEVKDEYKKLSYNLAETIRGKIPIFYGSIFSPIAERFKQELNENAKYPAFYGEIPEVIHNELEVYSHIQDKILPFVIGDSEVDNLFLELSSGFQIKPKFKEVLKNISSLLYLAGLTSINLAEMLNRNPLELRMMNKARLKMRSIFKEVIRDFSM
jgi:glucose/mannose-6-phosphate isomerase